MRPTPRRARRGKRRGRGDESPNEADDAFETVAGAAEPKYYCGMCQDAVDPDDAAMTGCKHVFHRECITQYASARPKQEEGDVPHVPGPVDG